MFCSEVLACGFLLLFLVVKFGFRVVVLGFFLRGVLGFEGFGLGFSGGCLVLALLPFP